MNRLRGMIIVILSVVLVCSGAVGVWIWKNEQSGKKSSTSSERSPQNSGEKSVADIPQTNTDKQHFDKTTYSTTDPASLWIIANKTRPLPSGYTPASLVTPDVPTRLAGTAEQSHVSAVIAEPLKALFDAAAANNISIKLSSGYRSEALQKQFYDSYVARDGQAAADTYSARPGTSEHQTGLSVDIIAANGTCDLETCFSETPEGQWLAAHAHEYGFIIRYPEGKQDITGYQYEPWHLRYVGTDLAQELYTTNLTMEEFFNIL